MSMSRTSYVRDISNLSCGFAKGEYGKGLRDWSKNIASENGAIVAINGDYYGARSTGVVIRNGTLYRDDYSDCDVCVLNWDGTMQTFSPRDFNVDTRHGERRVPGMVLRPHTARRERGAAFRLQYIGRRA